jgi:serine protease AprX
MTNVVRSRVVISFTAILAFAVLCAAPASAAPGSNGRDVDVIVRAGDASWARAAVERVGGDVTHDLPLVDGVAARVPEAAVASLESAAGVRSVTPNAPVHVQAKVSDVHEATGVYSEAVGADELWAEGVDGAGVTVAVVDTGIQRVPDLAGRVIGGIDFTPEADPFEDSFGHGTFVAGLIAGSGQSSGGAYRGVAPAAKLVSIKIAGRNGASDITHVLAALQWAVSFRNAYGIRVLNLSLGTDSTQPYWLSPLNHAVERVWDSGIAVVVSASNLGVEGAGTVTKPGDDPLVSTTGATDDLGTARRTDDVMAGFSGMGPTAADGLAKPDLVAPGRSVVSLRAPGSKIDNYYPQARVGGAYFKGSGTSFSAGITSGAAALLLDREPGLSPDQVKARMLSTATPGPVGDPNVDGHGSLDVHAAAHAGTFESANQGVTRSLGLGSLDADRGTLGVRIDVGGLLGGLLGPVVRLVKLDGLLTGQNRQFDAAEYLSSAWTQASWYQSQWYGTSWYGTSWYGTSWYGTSWYGTSWYGTSWYGTSWYGTSWYGTSWYGTSWYGTSWYGAGWE